MTRTVVFLMALVPLVACGGSLDPDLVTLEANRAKWEAVGPSSYVYAVERLCFCPVEYRGPVRVTVQGGAAVAHVYAESGLDVPVDLRPGFPTVDGLFGILEDAYEAEAARIDVTYHPEHGAPVEFWIDYSEMVADEELGAQVTEEVAPIP